MTATILKSEVLPIRASSDVVLVRQRVRSWAIEANFSLVEQTKMVTAASELARNTLEHGKGGVVEMAMINSGIRNGLRLVFTDKGPGIGDVALALQDGYTSGKGMGLGLSGSKRLVNEFDIKSTVGEGTVVSVVRWK